MDDWADVRAREWLEKNGGPLEGPGVPDEYGWVPIADYSIDSLAALLRDVAAQAEQNELEALAQQLAEVRCVVEEIGSQQGRGVGSRDACDEILASLEKL